jgi:hypothetical protein
MIHKSYAKAIGSGIAKTKNATKINFKGNKMKPPTAAEVIKGIESHVKELDLSDNHVGD